MKTIRNSLAGLLLALVLVLSFPAGAQDEHRLPVPTLESSTAVQPIHFSKWLLAASLLGVFGTVVVTYAYPVSGTVAPTAAQMKTKSMITLQISYADTDTTQAITHNWGLSSAEQTDRFPVIIVNVVTAGTLAAALSVGTRAANTITLLKASATGSGGTFEVTLLRPHTLER